MKIAVLVSGGVDSSVALKLLQDEGHDITAFYLKIWLEDETAFLGICPWEEDLTYVRSVCEQLDVPLRVIPLQKEYHERVIAYAFDEVKAGRTPNPDVMCNNQVKFGAFLECAEMSGTDANGRGKFDKVATGHYARVEEAEQVTSDKGQMTEKRKFFYLKKSKDAVKDQTYFLSRLTQEQLSRALFPIGKYTKEEVRALAKQFNLPTKNRPDSQGLCFLGEINYDDFVRHHLGEREGDIVDTDSGKVLGHHQGYWFHTIGQRHGLDLPGGPWYVTGKDVEKNIVLVSHRLKMPMVERDTFEVENLHWLSYDPRSVIRDMRLTVKVRHGAREYVCTLEFLDAGRARVHLLDAKERGIAPGQFAVFYDGDMCLGNGVIKGLLPISLLAKCQR